MPGNDRHDVHRAIDAVWRIEAAKLIAGLARLLRDVGLAEELAQDAMVAALEQWPVNGIPDNPAAWLMSAARNRAIDLIRRRALHQRKEDALTHEIEDQLSQTFAAPENAADETVDDDLLRLMFIACHPLLSTEARVALTLRLLGGLTTDEIAPAPSWCRSQPSRSASSAPSARWPKRRCRSKCRWVPRWPSVCRRCSKRFT